jgi:hypothetical protein
MITPGKGSGREMHRPGYPHGHDKAWWDRPPEKRMSETLDKLEREGKITEAQAEQMRRWEKARPDKTASPEKFQAWMKARPDIPGLRPHEPAQGTPPDSLH